jgi:hypothetical protein
VLPLIQKSATLSRSRRFVLDTARFVGMGLHVKVRKPHLRSPDNTAPETARASFAPRQPVPVSTGFDPPPESKAIPLKHNKQAAIHEAMSSNIFTRQQRAFPSPLEPIRFTLIRFDSLEFRPINPSSPHHRPTQLHSGIRGLSPWRPLRPSREKTHQNHFDYLDSLGPTPGAPRTASLSLCASRFALPRSAFIIHPSSFILSHL